MRRAWPTPSVLLWLLTAAALGSLAVSFNRPSAQFPSLRDIDHTLEWGMTAYHQKLLMASFVVTAVAVVLQALLLLYRYRPVVRRWHFGKVIMLWPVCGAVAFSFSSLLSKIFTDDPATVAGAMLLGLYVGAGASGTITPFVVTWSWLGGKDRHVTA